MVPPMMGPGSRFRRLPSRPGAYERYYVSRSVARRVIGTIAAGLGLAFVFGLVAARLRLPPLVGYLVAGVAVGPFTPGVIVDQGLAQQLAEIGVILLMFGVGMHFSVADLLAVRHIALPGAAVQIAAASLLGAGV